MLINPTDEEHKKAMAFVNELNKKVSMTSGEWVAYRSCWLSGYYARKGEE